MTPDRFPEPEPLPKQYRLTSPTQRDETSRDWMIDALCTQTDPEAFFPNKGESPAAAQQVCAECRVRQICLDWSISNGERFGVWGGLSERDRRRRRENGAAA